MSNVSKSFLQNAMEMKPTLHFACTQMTTCELEQDARFSLVTYLVESMCQQIRQAMAEHGYRWIKHGPHIEREEWWDYRPVRGRGLRRLAERLRLVEPREARKHLGYVYRMSIWAS